MTVATSKKQPEVQPDSITVAEGWELAKLPDICDINPPKPPATVLPPDAPVTFVLMPAVDAELGAITNS